MTSRLAQFETALTPALARRAATALALASVAALLIWLATAHGGIRADGSPLGADFVTFHAAGGLALHGQLASAYDTAAIVAAEKASAPGERLTYLWRYPPTFALLVAPFSALPYLAAYALWSLLGLAALGSGVRRLLPGRDGLLLAAAAPATLVCLLHGQSAFLVAAAFAWGFSLLEKRPWLAGLIFGCLICKPHFAVVPAALLLVSGRWRALGGFATSAAALCALSTAAFGWAPWTEFLRTAPGMTQILAAGGLSWAKAPTGFTLALSLKASQSWAWGLQSLIAVAAFGAAAIAWRSPLSFPLKAATAVGAALLLSPYLFDYDLVLVTVAAALILSSGAARAPGVRLALLLSLATPVVAPPIAQITGLQLGVLPLLLLGAAIARAAWGETLQTLLRTYWSEAMEVAGSATGSPAPVRFTARVVG